MNDSFVRKRSPRAPLVSLKVSVDRASKVYEKEGKHPASANIVAQHLGYKSSDNGAAKQAIAALGYYGLVERKGGAMLAITKSFEEYKFAPSDEIRAQVLRKWLRTPTVFAELLEKFQDRLPSDASLKFELIQKGFNPATADECRDAFIDSVQYVKLATPAAMSDASADDGSAVNIGGEAAAGSNIDTKIEQAVMIDNTSRHSEAVTRIADRGLSVADEESSDKIPVRLANGRRAWLVIPSPFFAADKRRLISQIELLLADDEE